MFKFGIALLITVTFWPWMIGGIDLLGLFFVDHTITGIVWNFNKIYFSMIYPIIMLMCFAAFAGMS